MGKKPGNQNASMATHTEAGIRWGEVLTDRLEYCRDMLHVHGMISDYQRDRITDRIVDMRDKILVADGGEP